MREKITFETLGFAVATCLLGLLTHAIAYLTHEYAHASLAWSLGWMSSPWAIDYGHPTLYNLIFLGEVDDNVSYAPIFASGHGLQAMLIALAGPFLGNGLLYFALYGLARTQPVARHRAALALVYGLALMCAGNVWSYVPLRAITTHADIALAARGLQLSTWLLLPWLLIPALYIVYHFFCRMFPICHPKLAGHSRNASMIIIAATAFWFFSFFGGDGIDGSYGTVSQLLSIASRYLLFPLCVMYLAASDHGVHSPDPQPLR